MLKLMFFTKAKVVKTYFFKFWMRIHFESLLNFEWIFFMLWHVSVSKCMLLLGYLRGVDSTNDLFIKLLPPSKYSIFPSLPPPSLCITWQLYLWQMAPEFIILTMNFFPRLQIFISNCWYLSHSESLISILRYCLLDKYTWFLTIC